MEMQHKDTGVLFINLSFRVHSIKKYILCDIQKMYFL